MRTSKVLLLLVLVAVAALGTYSAFIYIYTDHMFAPVTLLAKPNPAAPSAPWTAPVVPFIHRVNTPARAQQKDSRFGGFEVDVLQHNGQLLAAHDVPQTGPTVLLRDIFAAVKKPGQKLWWLDLKQDLTPELLSHILQAAQAANIPTENLFFEASPGPSAELVKQHHLGLLLPLPEGFEQDANDPQKREALNAQVLALWQQYQPHAVAASFGKYGYLRAYFPNMPKAIYYSSTVRPSLKKPFMAAHIRRDPSVKIFMTDQYTFSPF